MNKWIVAIISLVVTLFVVGLVVAFVFNLGDKFNESGQKANEMMSSSDRATFKEFDDSVAKGSAIKAFITANLESDMGVVVITKKDAADGGLNYIRPMTKEDDTATYADRKAVEHAEAKGVFKNLIGIKDKSKWDEGNEVKGKFAVDDTEVRATSLKYAKRSGNKHEIIDNANFECKLIVDSNKSKGIYCIEKGVLK